MTFYYHCIDCGNEIPESAVITLAEGSKKPVKLKHVPVCCHGEMERREATGERGS